MPPNNQVILHIDKWLLTRNAHSLPSLLLLLIKAGQTLQEEFWRAAESGDLETMDLCTDSKAVDIDAIDKVISKYSIL